MSWRPVAIAVTVVALLAGVGAGAAVLWPRSPGYPEAWDPRVTDLVAFVESERGLTFEHPVHIDFLADADFRSLATGAGREADATARAELESQASLLRAAGLVTGDIDLAAMAEELHGDGTVGLYDFEKKRIHVRGETLDDERRSTLVHELTHALQDQHFGIGSVPQATSGAGAAFTAVVEADAEMVQAAWVDSLPVAAREALAAAEERSMAGADFAGVPPVFLEMMSFPYVLGPSFLESVIDERGASGRNEVLRSPPTTEEHIILPRTYLDRQAARWVPTPALAPGEQAIADSESDFGMLSLLVLLGERLDFSVAWNSVQGWAGDSSIGFRRDGRSCMRMKVLFDDSSQAVRFTDAFRAWADGRPATADAAANAVSVESCDPGAGAVPGRAENHLSGIEGFGLRAGLIASFVESGLSLSGAPCVADGLIARMGADRLISLEAEITERPNGRGAREVERVTAELADACPA